jgi:predicted dehydrogenase
MKLPLRLGLIGAGRIGQAYVEALGPSDVVNVRAVADVRPEAAAALGLDCPVFETYEALAASEAVDAVLVCTPPVTHHAICMEFLKRGVSVLCEKPLALNSQSAQEVVAEAQHQGVLLTMASKFRYVDDVIRAKRIVDSGILGEVILFENAFTSRVNMNGRWNADPAISGGGVLIDNGTHSVDITRYFLGPIANVLAVDGKRAQDLAVEDTAQIFIQSVGGVMATIDLSWSLNKERPSYVDIHGTQGTIIVGWRESRYRQVGNDDWLVFGNGYEKNGALRRQVENFGQAVLGNEQPLITAEDAIASVEVIEAAYASMKQNHWQPVVQAKGVSTNGSKLPVAAGTRT